MTTRSALMLWMIGTAMATAARADDLTVKRQVSADPAGKVLIDNFAGSVVVTGWDRPQISAQAELSADTLQLVVSSQSGRTEIRIERHEGWFAGPGGEARLTVQVPRGSQLSVTGVNADIRSTGVTGAQHLQAVSGDVDVQLFAAPVDARTVNGDIDLHGDGQSTHISAASVSGDVRLRQAGGDVQATSVSGNLQLMIQPAGDVHARTTSGDIRIDGQLASKAAMDLNTVSGQVQLQVGAAAGLKYDVNSFSGDIHDCFGQMPEHVSQYGPGMRLSGSRGNGEATLLVRTLSGDVSLCDRAR